MKKKIIIANFISRVFVFYYFKILKIIILINSRYFHTYKYMGMTMDRFGMSRSITTTPPFIQNNSYSRSHSIKKLNRTGRYMNFPYPAHLA